MPTVNWCYGAKAPDLSDAVDAQLSLAHKYRNRLCELEREKRDRYYELLRQHAPAFVEAESAVEAAEQELAETREAIQAAKKEQRTKKPVGVEALTDKAKELKAALKELRAARKAAKEEAKNDEALQAAVAENTQQHKDDCKLARSESGLYWGTAATVDAACRSFGSGAPPKFARWTGEGQLAVQLQKGLPVDDMLRPDTRAYISGSGRKRTLHFRIGSEGRAGIYAQVPLVFHRDLPEGGRIKWAYLERRRMANQNRWQVRLTIDVPTQERTIDDSKWCAVHVGWHRVPSGLQVAVWRAHDDSTGRLVLPNSHLKDYDRLSACQQYRDLLLRDAIDLIKAAREDAPDWFREETSHAHRWKTPGRIVRLLQQMGEHEWTGPQVPWPATPVELSRRIVTRRQNRNAVVEVLTGAGFSVEPVGKDPDYLRIIRSGVEHFVRISNHIGYAATQTKFVTLSDAEAAAAFLKAIDGGTWDLATTLRGMVRNDRHLWQHHSRLSARVAKRRNNEYRNLVATLTEKYDVLFTAKPGVKALVTNSDAEELSGDESAVHRAARSAAVSKLLEFAAEKFPLRTLFVDTKHLTVNCHSCGATTVITDRICRCDCGLEMDEDQNALRNTIARGHVMLQGGALLELQQAAADAEQSRLDRLAKMLEARRNKSTDQTARTSAS